MDFLGYVLGTCIIGYLGFQVICFVASAFFDDDPEVPGFYDN